MKEKTENNKKIWTADKAAHKILNRYAGDKFLIRNRENRHVLIYHRYLEYCLMFPLQELHVLRVYFEKVY